MKIPRPPAGSKVSSSFSAAHDHLLQIALGLKVVVRVKKFDPLGDSLDTSKLQLLKHMLELEFASALEKEIQSDEPADEAAKPNAYDVFLMLPSSPCAMVRGGKLKLAVLFPLQSTLKGGLPPPMMWFDGEGFWDLNPHIHLRRVSSLSGPARVLQALSSAAPPPLMTWAMSRQKLIEVVGNKAARRYGRDHPDLAASVNSSQLQAIATVASTNFQQGFFALQGPPGCGKTHTIVGMISAIGEGMIVAAPSNAAVANIASKLFETGQYELTDVTVVGDNCHESVRFLNPKLRSKRYKDYRRKCASANDKDRAILLASFKQWLHLDEKKDISGSQLKKLCPYIDTERSIGIGTLKKLIHSSKVILCTLNTAGSGFLRKAIGSTKFTTFLLDEGGQCSEAEFYIAATVPGVKRIIVMGDPKQLPATVIEPVCKNAGYGDSLLGHFHKLFPEKVHLLDTQYRMDPLILAFPNSQFYSNRIQSGANVLKRSPRVSNPVQFIDTSNGGSEQPDKLSWKNQFEANVIKLLLQQDEDIVRIRKEVAQARTIIITPYKAQVKALLATLATVTGLGLVDVATVDSFQGQEGDIVVVSTVRTQRAGFTDDPQRLNVALTRAKRVLRVVGNLDFFLSLTGTSSTLKALATNALALGHVVKNEVVGFPTPNVSVNVATKKNRIKRYYYK